MRYFALDLETTVEDDTTQQTETACWACAYAELYSDECNIFGDIKSFLNWLLSLKENSTSWFHNLKFDGSFIIDFLLKNGFRFSRETKKRKLQSKEFDVLITTQNRWYMIKIKYGKTLATIYDSAKLIPMTLKEMGIAFATNHQKLEMEYKGNHYPNCPISIHEREYILNDVFVLKESLIIMRELGNEKMTSASNALNIFKKQLFNNVIELEWKDVYVNLGDIKLDEDFYLAKDADEYIRKSYKGGWCYLNPKYKGLIIINGETFDVNSLYSSVMHSKSGNIYPVGYPHFFSGDKFSEILKKKNIIFFVTLRCVFNLKTGYLPTIQIKNNFDYKSNEWLTTSDIFIRGNRKHYKETDTGVEVIRPIITLTHKDYELFIEHYEIEDLEILHGCWFSGEAGFYDKYIDYHMEIKMNSKGGKRTEAKLKQNSLYGKLSTSRDSSYMEPYIDEEGILQLIYHEEYNKNLVSIAHGSLVTSYARYFTITQAQKNYNSFIYADTDSIHKLDTEKFTGKIHKSDLLCWKHESSWKKGKFIRQKTYIEVIKPDKPPRFKFYHIYYGNYFKLSQKLYIKIKRRAMDIKCAGMSEKAKDYFALHCNINDFDYGLECEGNLKPKRVKGGTVLVETPYKMRK